MIDKDLFPYNLAVVAIMKNEEPYVKEWLEYHLLMGVDHFYIYDNGESEELKKILKPYIDAEFVTYTPYPGKVRQIEAYNNAIQRFRFECRYMAVIDVDEFIFPKNSSTITEIIDSHLDAPTNSAGLEIWIMRFGSSGHEKADYTKGVLERFTRRAEFHEDSIKCIVNPRRVDFFWTTHFPSYFRGVKPVRVHEYEMVVNHYHVKSREEFSLKNKRGHGVFNKEDLYNDFEFEVYDKQANNIVDRDALKYRNTLQIAMTSMGDTIETLMESKKVDYKKIFGKLSDVLTPTLDPKQPLSFFDYKMENYLICLNLIFSCREKELIGDKDVEFLLEHTINAIDKSLRAKFIIADADLLLSMLPEILTQTKFITKIHRKFFEKVILEYKQALQLGIKENSDLKDWRKISDLEYILRMLKSFDAYTQN